MRLPRHSPSPLLSSAWSTECRRHAIRCSSACDCAICTCSLPRTAFSSFAVMRRQRMRWLEALCHSSFSVLPSSSPRSPACVRREASAHQEVQLKSWQSLCNFLILLHVVWLCLSLTWTAQSFMPASALTVEVLVVKHAGCTHCSTRSSTLRMGCSMPASTPAFFWSCFFFRLPGVVH